MSALGGVGRRRVRAAVLCVLIAVAATGVVTAATAGAKAKSSPWATDQPGVQHLQFEYGPIDIAPGQNNIVFDDDDVPKPDVDGYIVGIAPNLKRPNGSVPPVDVTHLHHGVWINNSVRGESDRGSATFFAAGEEKTIMKLPVGYGYPYKADDSWTINYMIHNLTPGKSKVFITYDIDFVPSTAPEAADITPARPIWMDVEKGRVYPVFDVLKDSGAEGVYTYPDDAQDPYPNGRAKNEWTVDRDSILLGTAGHLHPGGLHDDLFLDRAGAVGTPTSSATASPGTAHLFRSVAKYYEPAGAVSWDVSMTGTPADWRVQVHPGDTLRVNTTYDSKRASWYESMGIMIVWLTDGTGAPDPFTTKVDVKGQVTHGHLPENDHHGGKKVTLPDATKFKQVPASQVGIAGYIYDKGDMTGPKQIPAVKAGETITFTNFDDKVDNGTWHSITACEEPCNKETGIAYPLADAAVQFDSGQLGTGGPPTIDTVTWSTPTDLDPGTYTYFCRIHPFMRGAFAIEPSGASERAGGT
jgi:plastocyanin